MLAEATAARKRFSQPAVVAGGILVGSFGGLLRCFVYVWVHMHVSCLRSVSVTVYGCLRVGVSFDGFVCNDAYLVLVGTLKNCAVLRNRCMKLHGVYRIGCFRGIGNALNRPKELHLQLVSSMV